MSDSSFQSGLPARLAARSQSALTTAAIAMCMTPFSGPSQRSCESCTSVRHTSPIEASVWSTGSPTTNGSSARIAATCTSLPRPIVNANPWPSRPSAASVRMTTYAAE